MPYISPEEYERARIAPATPGHLNFALAMAALAVVNLDDYLRYARTMCDGYLSRVGMSYTNLNAVLGVLACCGRELVRRRVGGRDSQESDLRNSAYFKPYRRVSMDFFFVLQSV